MHTYNYISDIYAKNTFGMAEFLPIHVQNFMLKKGKNKFWACSAKRHCVSAIWHWVMPNGTMHLVGAIFLDHFLQIFFFFFSTKGIKHGIACTWDSLWGARNQPLPLPIDPLTPPSSINTTIVFKAKGLESVEKN